MMPFTLGLEYDWGKGVVVSNGINYIGLQAWRLHITYVWQCPVCGCSVIYRSCDAKILVCACTGL